MKCPECGTESSENSAFCGECGYDFSSDNIMNTLDSAQKKENKPKKSKAKKEKPQTPAEDKEKRTAKLKIAAAAAAGIIVIVIIIIFALSLSSTEGEKVMKNVPIGRDLAYAESKTERDFILVSKYDALRGVAAYDGVCESERDVRIEGTRLPEWAVAVSLAPDNTIKSAAYYDFTQLQKTWKGHHSQAEISESLIEYGMNEKTVERKIGFKPYAVIKKIDNTASKIYRYYYTDASGNDKVCNYVVVFDDASGTVKDVYVRNIDFCGVMLSVEQ